MRWVKWPLRFGLLLEFFFRYLTAYSRIFNVCLIDCITVACSGKVGPVTLRFTTPVEWLFLIRLPVRSRSVIVVKSNIFVVLCFSLTMHSQTLMGVASNLLPCLSVLSIESQEKQTLKQSFGKRSHETKTEHKSKWIISHKSIILHLPVILRRSVEKFYLKDDKDTSQTRPIFWNTNAYIISMSNFIKPLINGKILKNKLQSIGIGIVFRILIAWVCVPIKPNTIRSLQRISYTKISTMY